jgi:hypothetical protein
MNASWLLGCLQQDVVCVQVEPLPECAAITSSLSELHTTKHWNSASLTSLSTPSNPCSSPEKASSSTTNHLGDVEEAQEARSAAGDPNLHAPVATLQSSRVTSNLKSHSLDDAALPKSYLLSKPEITTYAGGPQPLEAACWSRVLANPLPSSFQLDASSSVMPCDEGLPGAISSSPPSSAPDLPVGSKALQGSFPVWQLSLHGGQSEDSQSSGFDGKSFRRSSSIMSSMHHILAFLST